MRTSVSVVIFQPRADVRCQTDVVRLGLVNALQDINESFRFHVCASSKIATAARGPKNTKVLASAPTRRRFYRVGATQSRIEVRLRRSRGYGATALARLAEPKLGEAERRLVDQTGIEPVTS